MIFGVGDKLLIKSALSAAYAIESALAAAYFCFVFVVNGEEILYLCRADYVIFNSAAEICHYAHVLSQQHSPKVSPPILNIVSPS